MQKAMRKSKFLHPTDGGRLFPASRPVSSLPQVQQKVSEVEVREKELFDWRKKVSEAECKLSQQENLLECAVKERNLYSRNLIEAQVLAGDRWM